MGNSNLSGSPLVVSSGSNQPTIAHGSVVRILAADGTLCFSTCLFALPAQTSIGQLNIVVLLVLSSDGDGDWIGKRALSSSSTVASVD